MADRQFNRVLLHPKYWLTWFGFALWYLLSWLPYAWQIALGRKLGWLLGRIAPRRQRIAYANIRMCFPDLTEVECKNLVSGVLESVGIAFFETGMAWFWSKQRLQRINEIEGIEHLRAANSGGTGVILMAMHFTHLDLGGKLMGLQYPIDGSYRPHNNPVYDYLQRVGRERHTMNGRAIPRDDVRGMVKTLRSGNVIWYAPDHDYGPKHSLFVPLFGIPAATISATSQLARLGKARVVPFFQTRKADGSGYRLVVYPALENFPSDDEYADTLRINQIVESCIKLQPDQYLWVHRRFKTRPDGEPDLYEQFGIPRRGSG